MTLPSIVAGHTTQIDAVNTLNRTISTPTHSAGDFILVAVSHDSPNIELTMAGFESLFGNVPVSGAATAAIFVKEAGGSEPANYTIQSSVSERVVAIAFAVTGAKAFHVLVPPLDGSSATATVPGFSTGLPDILRISVVATDSTVTTTPMGTAAGHAMLDTIFGVSAGGLTVQYKDILAPASDPSATVSLAASDQWAGFAFGLSSENELHATKAGLYLDLEGARLSNTKSGFYLEAIQSRVRNTKYGAYIEAVSPELRTTKYGVYLELDEPVFVPPEVHSTKAGFYIELEPEEVVENVWISIF